MKILLLTLLFSLSLSAQDPTETFPGETKPLPTESTEHLPGETPPEESQIEKTVEGQAAPADVVVGAGEEITFKGDKKINTADFRADSNHSLMVGYQLLTTWLPSKLTASYTYVHSEKWSWELEYSTASLNADFIGVDLGEISEKRYSLLGRRYVGNSFHWMVGPVYQDFTARASTKILGQGTDVANFGAENLALGLGLGNRWQHKTGITFGIDWLRINVPLFTTKNENEILKDINNNSDSEDVKKIIRTFNRIPTFVVFGLNLGYTF